MLSNCCGGLELEIIAKCVVPSVYATVFIRAPQDDVQNAM